MTAWNIAKYIDSIAESGKAIYNIPMYDNVWLMEQNWWAIPGESYHPAAQLQKYWILQMVYAAFRYHSTDNYQLDSNNFKAVCASYARADNPLFMPETIGNGTCSGRSPIIILSQTSFLALNYPCARWFGSSRMQTIVDSMQCTAAVIPLLLKYQVRVRFTQ